MSETEQKKGLASGFDRIAPYYDRMFTRVIHRLWSATAELADPREGMRMLDVCCGTGGVSLKLASGGAEVVGIDISEGMLNQARMKSEAMMGNGGIAGPMPEFKQMSAFELEFDDNSFDIATVSMALHEMRPEKRAQAMKEMARVSKQGIVVADYHIPQKGFRRYMLLAMIAFEYWESPDFKEFSRFDFGKAFTELGLKQDGIKKLRALKAIRAVHE